MGTAVGAAPSISVVIPARNEEALLPRCLASIDRAQETLGEPIEVIVVLNRCTDRTEEIARAYGAQVTSEDRKNLSAIRNAGVKTARAPVVVTIDADSVISPQTFVLALRALTRPHIIGGGTVILPERWSLGIALTGLYLLPIALWYGISGGLFFCRTYDFWAIGGFNEALSSAEDIDFARRLKAHGKQSRRRFCTLWGAPIKTSCRKFDRFGDWYFALRPWLIWSLLKGRNQSAADEVWYDFEH
jgi:glycosyltransferase involved in cell wall biosynthesis